MNVPLLIGAIVRQTMVLIAELATTGGVRAPLAHVADKVFMDLVRELISCRLRGEPPSHDVPAGLSPTERMGGSTYTFDLWPNSHASAASVARIPTQRAPRTTPSAPTSPPMAGSSWTSSAASTCRMSARQK